MSNNFHIISLAGDIASGKGVVGKMLAEKLGYTIYKNGEYFRTLAKAHNMNVNEFNIYVSSHPEIDMDIERSAEKYCKEHDNIIIDARLGWYAVPSSFKVYLKVSNLEAAKRAFYDEKRKDTESFMTIEETAKRIKERFRLENERYFKLYGVHKEDMSNYDLVVDTTDILPEDVAEKIYVGYMKWLEEKENRKGE